MKIYIILICYMCLLLTGSPTNSHQGPFSQPNTAKTEIPGKGPCTNFPPRYHKLEERLAWFYGCMHENPPSVDAIKMEIAAMPPEKGKYLKVKI